MPACGRPPDWSGAPRGHLSHRRGAFERNPGQGRIRKNLKSWAFTWEPPWEPPWGIEPQTYALREARDVAPGPLPAQIAAHAAQNAPGARRAQGFRSTVRSTVEHASGNRVLLGAAWMALPLTGVGWASGMPALRSQYGPGLARDNPIGEQHDACRASPHGIGSR